jgi:hypothetical protein
LVQIHDTFEFITAFNNKTANLLRIADDYHELADFYTNQITAWKELREAIVRLEPNANEIDKNPDVARHLKRLNEIYEAEQPYASLKEVNGLISKVEAFNKIIIEKKMQTAISDIDNKIKEVKIILDEKGADADLRNHSLYPLQNTKKKVLAEYRIPNIVALQLNDAQEQYGKAFDTIEEKTGKGEDDTEETKKITTIKAADLTPKFYLESEEIQFLYERGFNDSFINTHG